MGQPFYFGKICRLADYNLEGPRLLWEVKPNMLHEERIIIGLVATGRLSDSIAVGGRGSLHDLSFRASTSGM